MARITFSNIDFLEDINTYYYHDDGIDMTFPDDKWEIKEARLFDMEYVENPYDYYNTIDPLDTGAKIKAPSSIGLVKRKQWPNECETRVCVCVLM